MQQSSGHCSKTSGHTATPQQLLLLSALAAGHPLHPLGKPPHPCLPTELHFGLPKKRGHDTGRKISSCHKHRKNTQKGPVFKSLHKCPGVMGLAQMEFIFPTTAKEKYEKEEEEGGNLFFTTLVFWSSYYRCWSSASQKMARYHLSMGTRA